MSEDYFVCQSVSRLQNLDLLYITFLTMETHLETPDYRKHCPRFTRFLSDSFRNHLVEDQFVDLNLYLPVMADTLPQAVLFEEML